MSFADSAGDLPRSPFPPIEGYAMLADTETIALVAASGSVEWLCAPRMDAESLFAAMLDRDAGSFRLGPGETLVPVARRYAPGSLILETTWMTSTGWLLVRDALVIGRWREDDAGRLPPHPRVPRDHRAEHVLLRTACCLHGSVDVTLVCNPVFGYGSRRADWEITDGGHRAVAADPGGDLELELRSDLTLGLEASALRARSTIEAGESVFAALTWAGGSPPKATEEASVRMARTERFWRDWLARGAFPDHPWRAHLQRSALALKGLIYAPTGAMVAAGTTSLPETPGGERNWDYRYTWIRDATFALWGLYTLGFDDEADDFFYFIADVAGDADQPLQIMYGLGGERRLDESTLDHLSGYENARPVRVGNAAFAQAQHDVWGLLVDSIHLHTSGMDHLPEWLWPIVERQVTQALEHWPEPDRGIWEVRGAPQHFTSSKLLCWVAADRGARLAELRGAHDHAQRWRAAAAEIHADVCANAVDERGVFVQHYGTTALDASCLLLVLTRFLPSHDERIRATVLAIAEELTEAGMVLRYRVAETDDGLEGEEGSFVICSFWLVSALVEIGEHARARDLCERLLNAAGPLDLYAEEIDPLTGRHLGNYPQAFSHLALINAVMHVIRAEQDARGTGRFDPAHRRE